MLMGRKSIKACTTMECGTDQEKLPSKTEQSLLATTKKVAGMVLANTHGSTVLSSKVIGATTSWKPTSRSSLKVSGTMLPSKEDTKRILTSFHLTKFAN